MELLIFNYFTRSQQTESRNLHIIAYVHANFEGTFHTLISRGASTNKWYKEGEK